MNGQERKGIGVVQNLGWKDRLIRLIAGTVMFLIPLALLSIAAPLLAADGASGWLYVLMLASLYPFWTATFGWDPVYSLFRVRSCGTVEENPCGTLPYELDAAIGRRPVPDSDFSHSLGGARHPDQEARRRRAAEYRRRQAGRR